MATDFSPTIQSPAMHTNTLAFEVPQPGTYEFAVSARPCTTERDSDCSSQSITANISFILSAQVNVPSYDSIMLQLKVGEFLYSRPHREKQSVMSPGIWPAKRCLHQVL